MTFHGDKLPSGPGDNNIEVERNIFISTPGGQAALTSWGANTRGVSIRSNVLAGGKIGLLLDAGDRGLLVDNNILNRFVINNGTAGTDWRILANFTLEYSRIMNLAPRSACGQLNIPKGKFLGTSLC